MENEQTPAPVDIFRESKEAAKKILRRFSLPSALLTLTDEQTATQDVIAAKNLVELYCQFIDSLPVPHTGDTDADAVQSDPRNRKFLKRTGAMIILSRIVEVDETATVLALSQPALPENEATAKFITVMKDYASKALQSLPNKYINIKGEEKFYSLKKICKTANKAVAANLL